MVFIRAFLFAPLLLAPGHAFAVNDCEINGESVNPANGSTTQNKTGIMRCRDRDSGKLQREQELRNGKFVGIVRYYSEGALQKEFSVNEQGNREGKSREFSTATGKVIREEFARNGTTVGISRSYYPEGQVKRISFRDDAGKELAAVEYTERGQLRDLRCAAKPLLGKEADEAKLCGFEQSGKPAVATLHGDKGELRGRLSHLEGVRVGTESYWDNGKLRAQEETGNDGRHIERSFDREGVKRQEAGWHKTERGRRKEYEQEFHDSGKLLRESRWQSGELASEKSFYLNGQVRTETLYRKRGGISISEVKEFYDSGKPAFIGNYAMTDRYNRSPEGEHRKYDAEGRLRQVRMHDAKGKLTRVQEFDESGRKTRDDEVFEDGSRKMK